MPGCEPLLPRGVDEDVRVELPTGNHDFTTVTLAFTFQRSVLNFTNVSIGGPSIIRDELNDRSIYIFFYIDFLYCILLYEKWTCK